MYTSGSAILRDKYILCVQFILFSIANLIGVDKYGIVCHTTYVNRWGNTIKYLKFDDEINPTWYTYIQAFIIMFIIMPAIGIMIAIPVDTIGTTILTPHSQTN